MLFATMFLLFAPVYLDHRSLLSVPLYWHQRLFLFVPMLLAPQLFTCKLALRHLLIERRFIQKSRMQRRRLNIGGDGYGDEKGILRLDVRLFIEDHVTLGKLSPSGVRESV